MTFFLSLVIADAYYLIHLSIFITILHFHSSVSNTVFGKYFTKIWCLPLVYKINSITEAIKTENPLVNKLISNVKNISYENILKSIV